MEETPAPGRFAEKIPPEMLVAFRTLLVIGGMSARALWRHEPNAVPQLLPLVAALEKLTGLTAADGEAMREYSASPDDTAREALLRPGRFYLFIAVGVAAYESALVGSPLLPLPSSDDNLRMAYAMAEQVYTMIEANPTGEIVDMPLDFDPFAHGHDPFESTEAAEAAAAAAQAADDGAGDDDEESGLVRMYTVDELRLIRLQIGTLFEHHAPALREAVLADRMMYTPDADVAAEEADEPEYHDFYHNQYFGINISFALRGIATTCLATSVYWFLSAAVPFARAAAQLRWLRRREATQALMERLVALDYSQMDEDGDLLPVKVEFSLAELLTLYQAQESMALALLNEEVMDAIEALVAANPIKDDEAQPKGKVWRNHVDWLRDEFDVSTDLGKLLMRNVPLFAALLEEHLTGDDAAEFAEARAEVAALAELATSPGAV